MTDDRVDNMQVRGPERERALRHAADRLREWAVSMPPAEPLVLDFGLGAFAQVGLIEYWIANELEAGYCGKYMFIADGQTCPRHCHRVKHETFFVMRGRLKVSFADETLELGEGKVLAIKPGRLHSFTGVGDTLMLELSMPCDVADNRFEDPRIMQWLSGALGDCES